MFFTVLLQFFEGFSFFFMKTIDLLEETIDFHCSGVIYLRTSMLFIVLEAMLDRPTNQHTGQPANQTTGQPANQSSGQTAN